MFFIFLNLFFNGWGLEFPKIVNQDFFAVEVSLRSLKCLDVSVLRGRPIPPTNYGAWDGTSELCFKLKSFRT